MLQTKVFIVVSSGYTQPAAKERSKYAKPIKLHTPDNNIPDTLSVMNIKEACIIAFGLLLNLRFTF